MPHWMWETVPPYAAGLIAMPRMIWRFAPPELLGTGRS